MDFLQDKEHISYFNQELIAKTATELLYNAVLENKKNVFSNLFLIKKNLLRHDKGNKVLENSIDYFLEGIHHHNIVEQSKQKKKEIHAILTNKSKHTSKLLSKKIKTGSEIIIHSLNNHLITSLNYSAKHNSFKINYLEDEHLEKKENLKNRLNKYNTLPNNISEEEIETSLKSTSFCLIGAKRLTKNKGAIVKKGSIKLIEKAQKNNVPVYVCAHSWSYTPKNNPKEHLSKIEKEHFEHIDKSKITAFITEEEIISPTKLKIN